MKIVLTLLLIPFCLVAAVAEPSGEPSQPGRYQLYIGKLDRYWPDSPAKLHEETVNTVYRIDTATGKTWYLERTVKKLNDTIVVPNQSWILIQE
jgi:hypothetical protein